MHESRYHFDQSVWWCSALRDLARLFLDRVTLPEDATVLDVGCGPGVALDMLSEYASRVVGMDISANAVEEARRAHANAELRHGDANRLADCFDRETFDMVTCFGVLYHKWVTDETEVLRQAWRILKPGGVILVTDPAFNFLRRRCDHVMMAGRRFTMSSMRGRLEGVGFELLGGTYFYSACFVPVLLMALWDRVCGSKNIDKPILELVKPPAILNEAMKLMMAGERALIRLFGGVSFGVQLLCLARKPRHVATRDNLQVARSIRGAWKHALGEPSNHGVEAKSPAQTADNLY